MKWCEFNITVYAETGSILYLIKKNITFMISVLFTTWYNDIDLIDIKIIFQEITALI